MLEINSIEKENRKLFVFCCKNNISLYIDHYISEIQLYKYFFRKNTYGLVLTFSELDMTNPIRLINDIIERLKKEFKIEENENERNNNC